MCFAPQPRVLFRHLNLQKWSDPEVFCTFWLGNVLRATTACTFSTSQLPKVSEHGVLCTFWLPNVLRATTPCTFSTSQLPKVVRSWGVLYILTWKCAWRHNGVQFFISRLASWLRTRRFSEPTFRPSGATNHWKNTVFCDFPTFSRICIFFLLTLSLLLFFLLIFLFSLPLPCSAFHLSILSEVWLLNFLRPCFTFFRRLWGGDTRWWWKRDCKLAWFIWYLAAGCQAWAMGKLSGGPTPFDDREKVVRCCCWWWWLFSINHSKIIGFAMIVTSKIVSWDFQTKMAGPQRRKRCKRNIVDIWPSWGTCQHRPQRQIRRSPSR